MSKNKTTGSTQALAHAQTHLCDVVFEMKMNTESYANEMYIHVESCINVTMERRLHELSTSLEIKRINLLGSPTI